MWKCVPTGNEQTQMCFYLPLHNSDFCLKLTIYKTKQNTLPKNWQQNIYTIIISQPVSLFHGNCALLGYYAASSGNSLPTFLDYLQGSRFFFYSCSLQMGRIGCPETMVRNYHYFLHNNPEECSSQLLHGWSLKSCINISCMQDQRVYCPFNSNIQILTYQQ